MNSQFSLCYYQSWLFCFVSHLYTMYGPSLCISLSGSLRKPGALKESKHHAQNINLGVGLCADSADHWTLKFGRGGAAGGQCGNLLIASPSSQQSPFTILCSPEAITLFLRTPNATLMTYVTQQCNKQKNNVKNAIEINRCQLASLLACSAVLWKQVDC